MKLLRHHSDRVLRRTSRDLGRAVVELERGRRMDEQLDEKIDETDGKGRELEAIIAGMQAQIAALEARVTELEKGRG
jgi:exonuclease VII small subunit